MRTLLFLLVVSCAGPAAVEKKPEPVVQLSHPAAPKLRLPGGVTPLGYEIAATVVPADARMPTLTRIRVRFDAPTDLTWLNATELEFGKAFVEWNGAKVNATAKAEGVHFVALSFASPVGPGEATLVIESTAVISRRDSQGVFGTQEAAEDYAYTQFEPIGARRAWPCFDEPGFKVPWQLTLKVPATAKALSNTNPVSETTEGGITTVQFAQTMPLPSYLIAFAVGPFDFVDAGRAGLKRVPVRIVVPKGRAEHARWAATVTREAIERLEAYFETPYPFEKADQVAISTPTWFGAMEHPGLISWAEGLLLSDPREESIERQRDMLETAVHELAHQWFGNLVTMAWWDDLWLNESFAQWMQARTMQQWKRGWGGELDRVESQDHAMNADSLTSARRLHQPIEHYDDVVNAFDSITYAKGEAVLNMFEQWLGPDVFRRGVQTYLAHHAWGNATAQDFLSAMSEAAGRDVSAPFSTFIDQTGVPLITAQLSCEPGSAPQVMLSQQRFVPLGSTAPATRWKVPVCVRWPGGQQCTLLESDEATLELPTPQCPAWVLPNAEMKGFYRSRPLSPALVGEEELSVAERLGVFADLQALTDVGEVSVDAQLGAVPLAVASGDRRLMSRARTTAGLLYELAPVELRARLAAWVRRQFPLPKQAPRPDDDEAVLLRATLLELNGTIGEDKAVRATAIAQVRAWLKARESVSEDTLEPALAVAAWAGDEKLFNELLAAARKEPSRSARAQLLRTLGSFRAPALAARARELLDDASFDVRETWRIIGAQSANPETREAAYSFVKSHYENLAKRLPSDAEAELVWAGTSECTRARLADVEQFFKDRTPRAPGGPRTWASALESLNQCIAWRERHQLTAEKALRRLK